MATRRLVLATMVLCGDPLIQAPPATAQEMNANQRLSFSITAGAMTENGINVVFNWDELEWSGNDFVGLGFAFERPLRDDRWFLGAEVQLNRHFGFDTYMEIAVPATLRYRPRDPWIQSFDSAAIGLGLSYATETPQVEIDRRGASQRPMVYMFYEAAFAVGDTSAIFARLHHRSDGYGLFGNDSGSNAFALGFRKGF